MKSAGTDSTHRQVAEAVAGAGGSTASRLGLRFDRVVVRVLDHLGLFVGIEAPEGLTVLLALTAPIRAPGKMMHALEQEVAALLQTGIVGSARTVVLYENRAELRLVEHAPDRHYKLLGFVHNPDVDAAQVLDLAEQWVRPTA